MRFYPSKSASVGCSQMNRGGKKKSLSWFHSDSLIIQVNPSHTPVIKKRIIQVWIHDASVIAWHGLFCFMLQMLQIHRQPCKSLPLDSHPREKSPRSRTLRRKGKMWKVKVVQPAIRSDASEKSTDLEPVTGLWSGSGFNDPSGGTVSSKEKQSLRKVVQ